MKRRIHTSLRKLLMCAVALTCALSSVSATSAHADVNSDAKKTDGNTRIHSKTAEERIDWSNPKYFTDSKGYTYLFYDIYEVEKGEKIDSWQSGRELSSGIFVRYWDSVDQYTQKYEDMDVWDKEGTFKFKGETYNYNLVPPMMLRREHRDLVENLIVHNLKNNPQRLSYFDYSKDGKIMVNDLVLLNKRLSSTPMNSVTNCDALFYDQMDKETFFSLIDYYMEDFRSIEFYIRYGDKVPATTTSAVSTTTSTTTSTTATVTTTAAESNEEIIWNTGRAINYVGNSEIYFEVKKEIKDDGSVEYFAPKICKNEKEKLTKENRINDLLGLPEKIGADESDFKLVASATPIQYSWVSTVLSFKNFTDSICQICPPQDLIHFKYIYKDGYEFVDSCYLINTKLRIFSIMWCPGSWIDYRPLPYDKDTILEVEDGGKKYKVDYLLGYTCPFIYSAGSTNERMYISLIPTNTECNCFGAGLIEPNPVEVTEE